MTAFAEALFFHNRAPLTLFVDEADQLAPQRVAAEQAKLLHNMEMLIRQGRQRGIFMWMLTQRPAVINKNLLSQAETLIAMKMTGPQDRKAIRDWMDAHDPEKAQEVEGDLAKLEVGQAWAWVPSADFLQRVQFPLFETYDSGRTPQHGEKVGDVELQPLDLGELAAALLPAEEEETELERLRADNARIRERNARLTRETESAIAESDRLLAVLTTVQDTIGMAIGSAQIVALTAHLDPADFVMLIDADDVVRPFPRAPGAGRRVAAARGRMRAAPWPSGPEPALPADPAAIAALMDAKLIAAIAGDVPAVRRIVAAVALTGTTTVHQIAELAGLSPTSSHLGSGIKRLVERGLLEISADGISLVRTSS
ncbi:helicase HerA-like domain-containing protein [Sphingomonas bacterium]|nr:helicase HerA-like domain-containing protein [Sphingomonas bacterium]